MDMPTTSTTGEKRSEELETLFHDIDRCMSVLQGDLHQPGTPAVVLRLESLWNKLKMSSQNCISDGGNSVAIVGNENTGGAGVSCRSEAQGEHTSTTQSSSMEQRALYCTGTLGVYSKWGMFRCNGLLFEK